MISYDFEDGRIIQSGGKIVGRYWHLGPLYCVRHFASNRRRYTLGRGRAWSAFVDLVFAWEGEE